MNWDNLAWFALPFVVYIVAVLLIAIISQGKIIMTEEVFYIESFGGIPICVEVNSTSKNYKVASAEMVKGLTRRAMQSALVENYPDFFIDDLYVKDGYMYAQLRRKVME